MPILESRYANPTGPEFSRIHLDPEMGFLSLRQLPIFVGLTGPTKSGKTLFAKHLVTQLGFTYVSTSGVIQKLSARLGMSNPSWKELGELARLMRRRLSNNILAKEALRPVGLRFDNKIVFDGILHPSEAELLLSFPNSLLIGFVADVDVRHKEASDWYSDETAGSLESIKERDIAEQLEEQEGSPEAPNLKACLELAGDNVVTVTKFNEQQVLRAGKEILESALRIPIEYLIIENR